MASASSRLRIAWVVYGGLHLVSGGFVYDRMVVERLRQRGIDVDEVALPWPAYPGQLLQNFRPIRWPRPAASYQAIIEDQLVHPALVRHNYDLRRRGVPVIALVHNLTTTQPRTRCRPLKRVIEDAYLRSVDGFVCVCDSTRRDLAARVGDCVPSCVAYAGRDHVAPLPEALRDRRARAPGALRVLFLAHVLPHKGLHRLIETLALVPPHVPVELDVVGAAPQRDPYVRVVRARVAALGLASRVTFHGQLLGSALQGVLQRAHVLALPSDREAYPLSCLEALAAGLVVLTTPEGGTGELLAHGREGFLLPPDDHAAWADTMTRLARDRELLAAMGRAAHARWLAHGVWRDTADVFFGAIRRLARS